MDQQTKDKINTGALCPYCLSETYLTYGKYGNMLKCDPCNAWVSTTEPKGSTGRGRLANYELRILRQKLEAKKRQVIANGWFKKSEFQRMVYSRGNAHTENIYLLNESGIKNILDPLIKFIDFKVNNPWKNNRSIKALFKIEYFERESLL